MISTVNFFLIKIFLHTARFLAKRKMSVFLYNQPDALIIPILFCYKTLHVSGIYSAHHQEFSTVHSALLSFMQVFDDRFQAESRWNYSLPIIRSFLLYIWHW